LCKNLFEKNQQKGFEMNIQKFFFSLVLGLCTGGPLAVVYAIDEIETPYTFSTEADAWLDVSDVDEGNFINQGNCNGNAGLEYTYVGGDYGSWVYVTNKDPSKAISVTIETSFAYQGQPRIERNIYSLAPGEKKYVGNTHSRTQAFHRKITGCQFR